MEEVWKDIVGYEGLYQVSNYGRVKSLDKIDSKGYHRREKILRTPSSKDGYCQTGLTKEGIRKMYKVHRLVADAFISNPKNKPQVNHIDGNKTNNHITNLEWVTRAENMKHAYKIGLTKGNKGHKHSEKTKNRMSNSHKDKYGIKVICITTGEVFSSIRTASQNTNATENGISLCCKGKQNYSGKSLVTNEKLSWQYLE